MFPQMQQAFQTPEDGGQVPGFRKGMETKVTTAGIPICKLPKVRLLEGIEFLEETLDSTLTAAASCDQVMLPIIIWSTKSSSGQERVLALAEAACGLASAPPQIELVRPKCQCKCGCRRQPGKNGRRTCGYCSRKVGPGCCWVHHAGQCHWCFYEPVDAEIAGGRKYRKT